MSGYDIAAWVVLIVIVLAGKEVWQLYNVEEDPTELNDLAKSHPKKLKEL